MDYMEFVRIHRNSGINISGRIYKLNWKVKKFSRLRYSPCFILFRTVPKKNTIKLYFRRCGKYYVCEYFCWKCLVFFLIDFYLLRFYVRFYVRVRYADHYFRVASRFRERLRCWKICIWYWRKRLENTWRQKYFLCSTRHLKIQLFKCR